MFRSTLCLLSLSVGVDAIRSQRSKTRSESNATGSPGWVDTLITYGAPKVSVPALRNPIDPDGCFPGWRAVNKNDQWWDLTDDVDLVPTLLGQVTGYEHVRMPVQFIDGRGRSKFHECGWRGRDINTPKLTLHFIWTYVSRANKADNLREATTIGLDNSYDSNVDRVATKIGEYGWNLVSAVMGWEVVHLMQNPRNNDCILTFGGSDTIEDFVKDVVIVTTTFCGLEQRVHTGFKWEFLDMVKDSGFQDSVRPNLAFCSKLDVIGHSLGGAVAALFTACLHNRPKLGEIGYDDYKWISFNKQASRALPAMSPKPEVSEKILEHSDGIA
jgi:hypothetical protein